MGKLPAKYLINPTIPFYPTKVWAKLMGFMSN